MTTWTSDELDKIGTAEELVIAPPQGDGTLRNPVTIWVVRLGDVTGAAGAYGGYVIQLAKVNGLVVIDAPEKDDRLG